MFVCITELAWPVLGCRVYVLMFTVLGFRFRVWGLEFRVQSLV